MSQVIPALAAGLAGLAQVALIGRCARSQAPRALAALSMYARLGLVAAALLMAAGAGQLMAATTAWCSSFVAASLWMYRRFG